MSRRNLVAGRLHNRQFRTQVVRPKRGKGSYTRKGRRRDDADAAPGKQNRNVESDDLR